jgi:hypothetical protein
MVPNSTTGGPGDKLRPNRAGYHAMAYSIDTRMLLPREQMSGTARAK